MPHFVYRKSLCLVCLFFSAFAGCASETNADSGDVEAKRQLAVRFLELAFNAKDVDAAAALVRDDYIQHNPFIKTGKQGFVEGITEWNQEHPTEQVEIRRTAVENELVMTHVRVHAPGQPDRAVMDIFRIQDGLIAEHWDVEQEVPPPPNANENGMF